MDYSTHSPTKELSSVEDTTELMVGVSVFRGKVFWVRRMSMGEARGP